MQNPYLRLQVVCEIWTPEGSLRRPRWRRLSDWPGRRRRRKRDWSSPESRPRRLGVEIGVKVGGEEVVWGRLLLWMLRRLPERLREWEELCGGLWHWSRGRRGRRGADGFRSGESYFWWSSSYESYLRPNTQAAVLLWQKGALQD